jgi:hypothetical protein
MKHLKLVALAAACLGLTAGTASAQMGMGMRPSMPHGVFNPVVGSGAIYETTNADGKKSNTEFAIVGKESVNGKDGFWMEYSMNAMGNGEMVVKTLVVPGDSTAVSRMIMQMPGRPPMEMTGQMGGHMNGGAQSAATDIRSSAEDVGSESITVPAGTFTCEHYRMKDGSGDTWVSNKVAPLSVVKHQGKDSNMVLVKTISDAKDKIVGTPQPFNPAMMMQQSQQ